MANNLAELEYALVAADKAGDEDAARILADEISRLRSGETAAQPSNQKQSFLKRIDKAMYDALPDAGKQVVDVLKHPASGVTEGLASLLNLPNEVVRAIGEAVGADPSNLPISTAELKGKIQETGLTAEDPTDGLGRVTRRMGQEVGAAGLAAVPVLKAAEAGVKGYKVFRPAIEAAKANAGKFVAADLGAAASGGAGAGIAKEIAPESRASEFIGTLLGAAAPTAAAGSLRALVRGGDGTRKAMEQSVKEFAEAGVTPTVGMATGRRFNEAVEAGLAILPGSSGRMAVYAESTARKLYDRVDDVTAGLSPLRSTDTAGAAIQSGIKGFVSNFKDTWRKLDAGVAKYVKPDDVVPMRETRIVLTELADPINVAAYPQIGNVAKRLDEISPGGSMRYVDLRTLRSSVGGLIPDSYASNLPQGQLKRLYAAMSNDLRNHLQTTNPKALAAFNRSNQYYTAAMSRLDERLAPLTASDIPERVFLALERSGHAGRTVINAAKRSIGKDNWDVVAATVFQRMGTATPGAQNVAGDVFSVQTFLTNWAKYGESKGALEALLQGTSGGAKFVKDMNAIAKVSEHFRKAGRVFANPSGTARAIANVGLGTSIATSALTGNLHAAATILTIAGGANLSARGFTNPDFINFLARSTEVPAARLPGLIARLGTQLQTAPESVQVEMAAFLDRLSDEFSVKSQQQGDRK